MANVIVCPKCKKGLRVNGPVPAGKRVTCPACQQPFVTGSSDAPTSAAPTAAVQAKKPPPLVSKTSPKPPANQGFSTKPQLKKTSPRVDVVEEVEEVEEVDDVEEVRPRGRRADVNDDDDRPRRRRDADDDDAEEDDDRSPRRKKKKKKSGSNLGLVLGLSGGGLVLLILIITGFVWPAFFLSGRGGGGGAVAGGPVGGAAPGGAAPMAAPGEPNPLAFMPGDANLVAGINVAQVRNQPQFFQGVWTSLQKSGQPLGDVPAEIRNVFNTTDSVMMAAHVDRSETPVIVLTTSQPYDAEKIKPHLGPATTMQGQTIYADKGNNPKQTFIGMPSPKILVLGQLPAEQFAALMARGSQVQIHADLQQQIAATRGSSYWVTLRFDENMKQSMQFALQDPAPGAPPEVKNIATIVQRSKGLNFTADLVQTQHLKLTLGVACNDANDAGQLRNSVQTLWNTEGKKAVDASGALGGAQFNPVINEVNQSLAFDQRDATAAMTVQLNLNTVQQLANAPNNPGIGMPFGPGGFRPPLPPGFNTKKKGPPIGPPPFKKKF